MQLDGKQVLQATILLAPHLFDIRAIFIAIAFSCMEEYLAEPTVFRRRMLERLSFALSSYNSIVYKSTAAGATLNRSLASTVAGGMTRFYRIFRQRCCQTCSTSCRTTSGLLLVRTARRKGNLQVYLRPTPLNKAALAAASHVNNPRTIYLSKSKRVIKILRAHY